MAISRYWRLVGICTPGNGALELSEARIYENGVLADAGATLSCTFAPDSGALTDLRDDLTTGVVSWGYAKHSAPGFTLVWDFGAGGGVEFPRLRLGSGSGAATYPLDLAAQSSTDGINWMTYVIPIVSATFPGAQTLTNLPTAGIDDPYWNAVVLAMHLDGANGSTAFTDLKGKPVTTTGNVNAVTANKKFGTASAYFDGSGDALALTTSTDFDFGTGDFTIEFWVYIDTWAGQATATPRLFERGAYNSATSAWIIYFDKTNGYAALSYGSASQTVGLGVLPQGVWTHLAVTRVAGSVRRFLNGAPSGLIAVPNDFTSGVALTIGNSGDLINGFKGYLDDIRITKGVARYTDTFTPPTSAFKDTFEFLPVSAVPPSRTRQLAPTPERLLPVSELPVTTAHGHLREFPFFDVYNGGIGLITGTVKEKALPANTPLHRRVLLVDERSQMVIRETWSDATTGAYEFRGVKQGVKYTVLAYDYSHTYRAVIADNLETT